MQPVASIGVRIRIGAEQGMQVGMHHDGMRFFPFDARAYHSPHGLALQGRGGKIGT